MRNLKKVLALVLSLVMALSMVTIASAYEAAPGTSFTDDKAITEFDEAVQVLEDLRVFKGRADGSLDPNTAITRAEAAAVVYRAVTGDVNDRDVGMFADNFVDVSVDHWAAGYIGYCANHGIMKGFEDGSFRPDDKVTGYQTMAMILRAIGYNSFNEFTGSDWQAETAQYWNLAGIRSSVNQAALRKEASRAVVGEIVFRAIVEASTVKYNALYKYEKTNETKAWEVFGLFGGGAAADSSYDDLTDPAVPKLTTTAVVPNRLMSGPLNDTPIANAAERGYDEDDLAAMTTRGAASVDLVNYEVRYGEPVAYWLIDGNKDGTAEGVINVLFNPVKTYTTAVTDTVLYLDSGLANSARTNKWVLDNSGLAYDTATLTGYGYNTVNGVADTTTDTLQNATALRPAALVAESGKGVLTNLYVVGGVPFVTSMHTYVADVAVARHLDADGVYRVDLGDNTAKVIAVADGLGVTTGLKAGTVVLYTEYDRTIDIANVKAATSKNVEVTNSYITWNNNEDVANSYFLAGPKFEYDATYGGAYLNANGAIDSLHDTAAKAVPAGQINAADGNGNASTLFDLLLDREQLIRNRETAQTIYFDDYGYVIYSTTAVAAVTRGYMVVTSGTYGGLRADNQFVVDFKGYNQDGTAMTISGGLPIGNSRTAGADDRRSYYNNADSARAYSDAPLAIYYYEKDAAGLYTLDSSTYVLGTDKGNDATNVKHINLNGGQLLAGDPDALDNTGTELLDDNTVFVIAKYNDYGVITNYDVVQGFKKIPDLTDANLVGTNGVRVDFEAYYVSSALDLVDLPAPSDIELVLVLGAEQNANELESIPTDEVFYLLDATPEEQYNLYDRHDVVVNGARTTRDLVKGLAAQAPISNNRGLYVVERVNAAGYIREVKAAPVQPAEVKWAAAGVLASPTYDFENDGTDEGYITLADNAKVYFINSTTNTCVELNATQIAQIGSVNPVDGCVAGNDQYGYATVVYVIDDVDHKGTP